MRSIFDKLERRYGLDSLGVPNGLDLTKPFRKRRASTQDLSSVSDGDFAEAINPAVKQGKYWQSIFNMTDSHQDSVLRAKAEGELEKITSFLVSVDEERSGYETAKKMFEKAAKRKKSDRRARKLAPWVLMTSLALAGVGLSFKPIKESLEIRHDVQQVEKYITQGSYDIANGLLDELPVEKIGEGNKSRLLALIKTEKRESESQERQSNFKAVVAGLESAVQNGLTEDAERIFAQLRESKVIGEEETSELKAKLNVSTDDGLFNSISSSLDITERTNLAFSYLGRYPQGEHRDDVIKIHATDRLGVLLDNFVSFVPYKCALEQLRETNRFFDEFGLDKAGLIDKTIESIVKSKCEEYISYLMSPQQKDFCVGSRVVIKPQQNTSWNGNFFSERNRVYPIGSHGVVTGFGTSSGLCTVVEFTNKNGQWQEDFNGFDENSNSAWYRCSELKLLGYINLQQALEFSQEIEKLIGEE
ncbi:MAG: hypothetical protein KJ718_05305 [Nanoarchaeota archaeon]|nr:hypothetical protein [Nanoarchaeota archaeon]MBU1051941.1 hypothetical protein [Nanoarchaeota archaeon]MBU1988172.1 hypothetical protein [Nanoarchaeota archaeon]